MQVRRQQLELDMEQQTGSKEDQHTVHTLGWKGLGMAPCPRLLSLGVPILASSFPVTSPSSRDSFSRALWQDLECVCVRAGGEG